MRAILTALLFLLFGVSNACTQIVVSHQSQVTVSLRSFDPLACTGPSHNDAPVFTAFQAAYAFGGPNYAGNATTNLFIPAGAVCHDANTSNLTFTNGIANFVCNCNGVLFDATTQFWSFGPVFSAQTDLVGTFAATQAVQAGSTCVTLLTPSQASLFTVGKYANMQGYNLLPVGFPTSVSYWDYVIVKSKSAVTGVICFDRPLKYSYKSTWPNIGFPCTPAICSFNSFGPAALYQVNSGFEGCNTWIGVTWGGNNIRLGGGACLTFINNTWSQVDEQCPDITTSISVTFINNSMPNCAPWTTDKEIDNLTISGGTYPSLKNPNPNLNFNCSNATFTGIVNGVGQNFVGNNCNFNGGIGLMPASNGALKSFYCKNCSFSGLVSMFLFSPIVVGTGNVGATAVNGVITIPESTIPNIFLPPGCCYQFGSMGGVPGVPGPFGRISAGYPFAILDVTQSGTNIVYSTDLFTRYGIAGFPPLSPIYGDGTQLMMFAGFPQFTCINCTGLPPFSAIGNAPAGTPLGNYSQVVYSCGKMVSPPPTFSAGKLISATFNVTTADTTQPTLTVNASNTNKTTTAGVTANIKQVINLKTAGIRVVTPSSITGAQAGDVLTSPGATDWYNGADQFGLAVGGDPTSDSPCPSITVTILTEQTFKGGF